VGFKVFWGCVILVEYYNLLDKVWSRGFHPGLRKQRHRYLMTDHLSHVRRELAARITVPELSPYTAQKHDIFTGCGHETRSSIAMRQREYSIQCNIKKSVSCVPLRSVRSTRTVRRKRYETQALQAVIPETCQMCPCCLSR